jgi:hypothetical protein
MISIKKKDWIEIVLHIAFWVGVFYTLLSLSESHVKIRISHDVAVIKKDVIIQRDVTHTLSPQIFVTLGFLALLFYGNIFLLFKKALRYKNMLIRVAIPVLYFFAIFMANYNTDKLLSVQNHGQPVMHAFELDQVKALPGPPPIIKKDRFLAQTNAFVFAGANSSNTVLFVFIIVFGLSVAYFFLQEWGKAEKFRSQLEAVQLDTEIKFLKSQVNPHFLFNTLNNLFSMAQGKGNDELADGISKLSGMMRYMIYDSNAERVPLADEIAYIKNCIALNKLRYADEEAEVTFDYPDQIQNIFIAPMLFIPFIENAFKHGVVINQPSQIDIAITVSDRELLFSCENKNYSFVKKMDDQTSGIGLENVKRRLELVYPGKYELLIKNDTDKYAVKLKISLT